MRWYRIEISVGVGITTLLDSSREFVKRSDREALSYFRRLERQAEKDEKQRRLVTKPRKIVRIEVREKVVDITPGGENLMADVG